MSEEAITPTPALHDRPTGPGWWVCVGSPADDGDIGAYTQCLLLDQEDLDRGAPFHTRKVFGPLPLEDK